MDYTNGYGLFSLIIAMELAVVTIIGFIIYLYNRNRSIKDIEPIEDEWTKQIREAQEHWEDQEEGLKAWYRP